MSELRRIGKKHYHHNLYVVRSLHFGRIMIVSLFVPEIIQ